MTDAQIKTLVADNLASDKLYGTQLYLTNLIERKSFDAAIPRYRLRYNDADITSLSALIDAIAASAVKITASSAYYSAAALCGIPVVVSFPQITATLDSRFESDAALAMQNGAGTFTLCFVMNYVNDGDSDLPLKILNVVLS